jgi:hypothetical protein
MEDMQKLWEHGVNVWDEYKKEHFNLKANILCMINDNPARLRLQGRSNERQDVSFVWIRQKKFIFHLQVNWCTCSTIDSYHLNTGIINGYQFLMV